MNTKNSSLYSKVKNKIRNILSQNKMADLSNARQLANSGYFLESGVACKELIKFYPADPEVYIHLGYVSQQLGNFETAITACKTAINLNPKAWQPHFTLGLSLHSVHQYSEAVKYLQTANQLAPDHQETITLLMSATVKAFGVESLIQTRAQLNSETVNTEINIQYVKSLFEEGLIEKAKEEINKYNLPLIPCPLISVADWTKRHNLPFLRTGDTEKIPVTLPPIFSDQKSIPESQTVIVSGNAPYVAELSNVTIFSNSGIILTEDNFVINDVATHPLYGTQVSFQYDKLVVSRKDNFILLRSATEKIKKENAAYMVGLASNSYGHWLPEFLPKIQYLEQHPEYKNFPLVVDDEMPESHFLCLQKITPNPILKLPANSAWTFKRLLVAPTPTFYPVELIQTHDIPQHEISPLSPQSMIFLRDRILPKMNGRSRFGKRLFLSRENMKWRRVSNDQEIATFLKGHDFEVMHAENYSLEEQILAFQNSECIVAPNGSALLNVIFSRTNIQLFVLSQPKMFNWAGYYGPMKSIGYEMIFVIGTEVLNNKHADYSIPIDRLKSALKLSGQIHNPYEKLTPAQVE